jgi:hypothetical protein
MVLQHGQEKLLREKGVTASNYHRHIYSPGGQDTGVYLLKVCFFFTYCTLLRLLLLAVCKSINVKALQCDVL